MRRQCRRVHHGVEADSRHSQDLVARTAARLSRTTAIARRAVKVARLDLMGNRASTAVRDAAMSALSRAGPAPFLRGFDGIADWRPPQPPYASRRTQVGEHNER